MITRVEPLAMMRPSRIALHRAAKKPDPFDWHRVSPHMARKYSKSASTDVKRTQRRRLYQRLAAVLIPWASFGTFLISRDWTESAAQQLVGGTAARKGCPHYLAYSARRQHP
jgi:hypothetical protein